MSVPNKEISPLEAARVAQYLPVFASRQHLVPFVRYMQPEYDLQPYLEVYLRILELFARGQIKRLIITMPPRHGKSQGSSRMLPAYMLGLNPHQHIAICSYGASLAQDFCRDVQRIMEQERYTQVFPKTIMPPRNNRTVSGAWLRNANVVEIVGAGGGGLRVVGRGGALSGKTVDVAILDDIYKDAAEGNSPVIREAAFKWYSSVIRKRMPKQQLIVFTRWHEDDLIGVLEDTETVITVTCWADLLAVPQGAWVKINFPAIQDKEPTEFDPRPMNTALWESRYPLVELLADRALDPVQFDCNNQGNPSTAAGRLYGYFKTYDRDPFNVGTIVGYGSYTDTADTGDDYLCSICYAKVRLPVAESEKKPRYALCITDVLYTQEPMEQTAVAMPEMLNRNGTRYAIIESNNGGRAFALLVRPHTQAVVSWFTQTKNKESRILTTAPLVMQSVYMPTDWATRWPKFHEHVAKYLRNFVGNRWHDAPDALTGCVERDIQGNVAAGVRRRN